MYVLLQFIASGSVFMCSKRKLNYCHSLTERKILKHRYVYTSALLTIVPLCHSRLTGRRLTQKGHMSPHSIVESIVLHSKIIFCLSHVNSDMTLTLAKPLIRLLPRAGFRSARKCLLKLYFSCSST